MEGLTGDEIKSWCRYFSLNKKVSWLAWADDVVLMAERDMREILKNAETYGREWGT